APLVVRADLDDRQGASRAAGRALERNPTRRRGDAGPCRGTSPGPARRVAGALIGPWPGRRRAQPPCPAGPHGSRTVAAPIGPNDRSGTSPDGDEMATGKGLFSHGRVHLTP